MNAVLWPHIAMGSIAILLGTAAISVGKGSAIHARLGAWFVAFMILVGITAAILEIFFNNQTGAGGLMTCYFVATSWMTARRRDGRAGKFEKYACGTITIIAAYFVGCGVVAWRSPTGLFGGHVPTLYFAFGSLCLLAAAMDMNFILRGILSSKQRLSRHLWRMCFGFFFATTSFFLGQRNSFPDSVRESPVLYALAFAPLRLRLLFWKTHHR